MGYQQQLSMALKRLVRKVREGHEVARKRDERILNALKNLENRFDRSDAEHGKFRKLVVDKVADATLLRSYEVAWSVHGLGRNVVWPAGIYLAVVLTSLFPPEKEDVTHPRDWLYEGGASA